MRGHLWIALFWAVVVGSAPGIAEDLFTRVYSAADGLSSDDVLSIMRDSHGRLWFGSAEGLSIFDGYQFTNITLADGLPHCAVSDVLEIPGGAYWVATYGGLCRFNPDSPVGKRFTFYHVPQSRFADTLNRLIQRRDRSLWLGSEDGLWRVEQSGSAVFFTPVRIPTRNHDKLRVASLAEDRHGTLWVASSDGLYALGPGKRIKHVGRAEGLTDDMVSDVLEDSQGRIWAATRAGVCRIAPSASGGFSCARLYRTGAPSKRGAAGLFESSDKKLWVAGWGLFAFNPDARDARTVIRRVAAPYHGTLLRAVAEDIDGNLWVGGPGVMKVTRKGFTTFSTSDGLRALRLAGFSTDHEGRLYVMTTEVGRLTVHRYGGATFEAVDPYLPAGFQIGWGDSQITFRDHEGDWWHPTLNGLLRYSRPKRFADLAHTSPRKVYTIADGLPDNMILRLFEDSRGDIWIGTSCGLARWQRRTGRIYAFQKSDGLTMRSDAGACLAVPQAISEDQSGNVWVGFHPSGLARFRDGRFEPFTETDGVPKGRIGSIYLDHAGRLWLASSVGGAARIDDAGARCPRFRTYDTAQGLSSTRTFCITEDSEGGIYVGGGHGVDRLDPSKNTVRHFTAANGLPPGRVQYCQRDAAGSLWFGSALGLARYVPSHDVPAPPDPPSIRALSVAGTPITLSPLGDRQLGGLRFGPAQNNVSFEFGGVNFRSGQVLQYQYRLEGADQDWSPASEHRRANYSSLAPGTYRFRARSVIGDSLVSPGTATVDFVIVPPFWRRPWALCLEAGLLASALYLAHWLRVRRLLQVERIRLRLASDLHDDIGAGLAEIAILSEVAVADACMAADVATRIGDRARQLRQSMADIVWSVHPRERRLADLTCRIGQTVYSMLETNGTRVSFRGPEEGASASMLLSPDRARGVLLMCKEAVTNISRHAHASNVDVQLGVEDGGLLIELRDDGRGFDPTLSHQGMGLRNLRRRAAENGGCIWIDSSPGEGSRVKLRVPLP